MFSWAMEGISGEVVQPWGMGGIATVVLGVTFTSDGVALAVELALAVGDGAVELLPLGVGLAVGEAVEVSEGEALGLAVEDGEPLSLSEGVGLFFSRCCAS